MTQSNLVSLVVHRLRLCARNAGGLGLIPSPVFKLACGDTFVNEIAVYADAVVFIMVPVFFNNTKNMEWERHDFCPSFDKIDHVTEKEPLY